MTFPVIIFINYIPITGQNNLFTLPILPLLYYLYYYHSNVSALYHFIRHGPFNWMCNILHWTIFRLLKLWTISIIAFSDIAFSDIALVMNILRLLNTLRRYLYYSLPLMNPLAPWLASKVQ